MSEQGCGLGRDVSVSRRSRDVLASRLGLVSDKILNVSVSSRSRSNMSRLGLVGLVSGLRPLRLVKTFCAGSRRAYTVAAVRAILTSMTFVA